MVDILKFFPNDAPSLKVNLLSSDEQAIYNEAVKQFRNEKARDSLRVPLNGSNLFKVLLLNQIGIRTCILSELEQIVQSGNDILRSALVDTPSVVLRSYGDSFSEKNDYLAKTLAAFIKKRDFNEPIVVNGLKLVEDNKSPYGLNFDKGSNFNYFEAPQLNDLNSRKKFVKLNEQGMPIFNNEGMRTLYTSPFGLTRLYLISHIGFHSNFGELAASIGMGRILVVKN